MSKYPQKAIQKFKGILMNLDSEDEDDEDDEDDES